MKSKTSKQTIRIRSLMVLPLLAVLIYSFSSKNIIEINPTDINNITSIEVEQEGATKKQIIEYNKLAKHYNNLLSNNNDTRILMKDVKRLKHLYSIMTNNQRKNAEPFPNFPPPPAPKVPQVREIVPPPPPIPHDATPEQKKKYKEIIKNYKTKIAQKTSELPPPPPPPKSPIEYIKSMSKKGAKFYYNDKPITSKEAINIASSNTSINLLTKHSDSKTYNVYLTDKPIEIKE